MIHVIATVVIKPGLLDQALAIYRQFVPQVLAAESGCLEYAPTVDFETGLANQHIDHQRITVRERWATLADFKAHLALPHTCEFRSLIKEMLAAPIAILVTQNAL
ncbi:MAG: antibiotic biosynthesis monooxygenase [Propionivibrio sp.]